MSRVLERGREAKRRVAQSKTCRLRSSRSEKLLAGKKLVWMVRKFRSLPALRLACLILCAFLLYGISLALIPLLPDWRMLFLPALLFGAAMGLNIPSLQTLLAGLAPAERRAAFMSINGMVLRLGQTLGPVVMGAMYVWGGMKAPFFGGALLAVGMVGLVMGTVGGGRDSGGK